MEVVIDFEYVKGRKNEMVVKELTGAAKNVYDSFRFMCPYIMMPHGSENGLNWEDGHIDYHEFHKVVREAVAGFAHLYGYVVAKRKFLSELWVARFSIWKILNVLSPHFLIIDAGAACLVTNFQMAITPSKPRIPS